VQVRLDRHVSLVSITVHVRLRRREYQPHLCTLDLLRLVHRAAVSINLASHTRPIALGTPSSRLDGTAGHVGPGARTPSPHSATT